MNEEIISAEAQHNLNNLNIGIYENGFETEILIDNLIGLGIRDIGLFGEKKNRILSNEFLRENNNLLDLYFEDYGEKYDFTIGENKNFEIQQKGINGGIEAAIVADEIRKKYAPLGQYDDLLTEKIDYNVKKNQRKKVLAIGAGGIGNYFCLGAEYLGHEVRLVDFDSFEPKNANRQIFCRSGFSKVKIIEKELSCIEGINNKFDLDLISKFDLEKYVPDVVVGCVDNVSTRNLIRKYSLERNIPYFDGGVGTTSGMIQLNPDERMEPKIILDKTETSCQFKPNPSVVIPNCIIGLKLAECAGQNYDNYEFYFDSKMKKRIKEIIK